SLAHIAKELREIGVRFQQADEVSGAAVAGNVATKSIGLKATQSNDDKGYQMAYNSQWHMWLPVNDQGVTDQAALQAYEKDKGKLDQGSLSQGMAPAQPPDQDLIQLQIEAFELGVNPFTGEPVTDDYAKMMISSLKWSQIVAGIGMVTGSMKSGKGPYKGRGTSAALDKVKQTIRDAKAKREQAGKSGKGTGQAPNMGSVVKDGNKTKYTNSAGNELTWVDQHPKNINRDVDSFLKSSDVGKATEAKVADFVRKEQEVTGFGQKVLKENGEAAGDLDVVTKNAIIEVKASIKAVKEDQFNKLMNGNHDFFFNPEQKKVILYIDKPLTNLRPEHAKMLEDIKKQGVTIVNSLEELKGVLH
ncbi:hypothetical protein DFQ00_1141, partial [Paenibacillus barcinonensis]